MAIAAVSGLAFEVRIVPFPSLRHNELQHENLCQQEGPSPEERDSRKLAPTFPEAVFPSGGLNCALLKISRSKCIGDGTDRPNHEVKYGKIPGETENDSEHPKNDRLSKRCCFVCGLPSKFQPTRPEGKPSANTQRPQILPDELPKRRIPRLLSAPKLSGLPITNRAFDVAWSSSAVKITATA